MKKSGKLVQERISSLSRTEEEMPPKTVFRGMPGQVQTGKFFYACFIESFLNFLFGKYISGEKVSEQRAWSLCEVKIMLVCLDPGHGGSDCGSVGYSLFEKDICLEIAFRVRRKLLEYHDISVTMTRSVDMYVNASERSKWANRQNADLFLSIHTNASPDPALCGFASYVSVTAGLKSRQIQCWLHNQLANFLRKYGVVDLGKKNDTETVWGRLQELRDVKMPAITIASLYITHMRENHLLSDPDFLDRYAETISSGIARIYHCQKKAPVVK